MKKLILFVFLMAILILNGCATPKSVITGSGAGAGSGTEPIAKPKETTKGTNKDTIKPKAAEETIQEEGQSTAELEQQKTLAKEDFISKRIFFDFDSYQLSKETRALLNEKVKWLKENKNATILVEGHCDERGTTEYNMALGEKRANAVSKYLINSGISASRIETISYGEEKPFVSGQTEEAWAQNRCANLNIK